MDQLLAGCRYPNRNGLSENPFLVALQRHPGEPCYQGLLAGAGEPGFEARARSVWCLDGGLVAGRCLRYQLGPEDDLAVGVAAFELGVGLADLRQRVDVRDRHLEVSVGDQGGQFGEYVGAWPGR